MIYYIRNSIDGLIGFYYLNSRYYNPVWGRFLNADGVIGANGDILGNILYAYCSNNSISKKDLSGIFFEQILEKAMMSLQI